MIRGGGILFLAANGQALFMKRSPVGDHAGEWCFPGGKLEGDETPAEAAVREAAEETGTPALDPARLKDHTRTITIAAVTPVAASVQVGDARSLPSEAPPAEAPVTASAPDAPSVDFTTFLCRVAEPFAVTLNEEHTGYAWADTAAPPEPLHPGCAIALARLSMDELGVARAMAAGQLTSPQRYENVWLFAMRITGTGVAYRSSLEEYVWRDPAVYMNEEFLARCNGLSVIYEHPKKAALDAKEFKDRVAGSIMLPYLKPEVAEVWGIAKIYDDEVAEELNRGGMSTSPAVVFRGAVNTRMTLEDGSPLLIEGKPSLLDHLAICGAGVWDKGGEPSGVAVADSKGGTIVAGENEDTTEEMKADADAGQKLDKVLARLDAAMARMDAMEEERKADAQARADAAKKDEDESKEEAKADSEGDDDKEKGEPERVAADEDEDEDAKADAIADALMRPITSLDRRIADIERALPKQLSDPEFRAMADAQASADRVYQAFGDSAPRPMNGEDLAGYRRRLANGLKRHSKAWGDVNIHAIADDKAFDVIEKSIYADAMATATSPADVPAGQLRELVSIDSTGRKITNFVGDARAWMQSFAGPALRQTRLGLPPR